MNLSKLQQATATTAPRTSGVSPFSSIELHLIDPNPDQPRIHFDQGSLSELAESIKNHGLIQPIAVVRRGLRYMIVSGERRFQAHKIIGALTIRAHVLEIDDHTVQEIALIENIQRDDLTDFERAKFIVELWDSGRYATKGDLARTIGKTPAYVSKAFSAMKLPDEIIDDLSDGKRDVGLSVLDEISRLDPAVQVDTYQRYNAGEIKRDEFKEAAKPKAEKFSRGEKETWAERRYKNVSVKTFKKQGSEVIATFSTYTFDPHKNYSITIEEV